MSTNEDKELEKLIKELVREANASTIPIEPDHNFFMKDISWVEVHPLRKRKTVK